MNENNNRVVRMISAGEFATITNLIADLERFLLPYTVGLTPDERRLLPKINVDNRMFIQDAITEMKLPGNAAIVPPFFRPIDVEIDLNMFDQCESLSSRLSSLTGKVDNTRILAGSEAYSSALTFKRLADAAELAGIPGADVTARKLRERFKGQGPGGAAQAPEKQEIPENEN